MGPKTNSVRLLTNVYEMAGAVLSGKGRYTTINELTDQIPATRPDVLDAALDLLVNVHPIPTIGSVVLSEEDKGAALAGLFSMRVWLPLAMARHNVPYKIPGSFVVPLSMEYADGELLINGLKEYDKVILIDDTLASGGTMAALVEAVRLFGAEVVDIRVVVEKLGYGGRDRVSQVTDVPIHSGIGIRVYDREDKPAVVRVEEVLGCAVPE